MADISGEQLGWALAIGFALVFAIVAGAVVAGELSGSRASGHLVVAAFRRCRS